MTRRLAAGVVGGLLALGCRAPTQITVVLSTDVPCAKFHGENLYAGLPVSTSGGAMASQTGCGPGGNAALGTFVLAPAGSETETVDVLVVGSAGNDSPDRCAALADIGGTSCIVARRSIAFFPHTPLTLPIRIEAACIGVTCLVGQTCSQGVCGSATTVCDPGQACNVGKTGLDGGASDAGSDAKADASKDAGTDARGDASLSSPSVLLFGGVTDCTGPSGPVTDLAWSFTPTGWKPADPGNVPGLVFAAMGASGTQTVLVTGMDAVSNGPNPYQYVYDGSKWGRLTIPSAMATRFGAAVATLKGTDLVLTGGATVESTGLISDGLSWEWDGTTWLQIDSVPTPARYFMGMASIPDHVVLFGGATMVPVLVDQSDTWAFAGTTWSPNTTVMPTVPPARDGYAMARHLNEVVMFGGEQPGKGMGAPVLLGDTWTYNGTLWVNRTPDGGMTPPARVHAAMATLKATSGDKVVLFGGSDGTGTPLKDTWLWDGTTWTELPPSAPHPSGRCGHAMASR